MKELVFGLGSLGLGLLDCDVRGGDRMLIHQLFKRRRSTRDLGLRTFIAFLILVSSPVVQAQEVKGDLVKVEYDAQKDATQISLNPIILISRKHEELRLGAVTGYPGKVKVAPREVVLVFVSLTAADVNKYEAARKLTVIIGEQRLPQGETKRTKLSQGALFMETMTISIPMDLFLRMGRAKEVTLKLGFTEVPLTPQQITILRAAGSYMTE